MILSKLEIGSLTLTPAFDASKYSYTLATSNSTNTVKAECASSKAKVTIKVNGAVHVSGEAAAWLPGINTVEVISSYGTTKLTYTVIVTNSGTLKTLTVGSAAGTNSGDTKLTITGAIAAGCVYKYKIADASLTLPVLDAEVALWDNWDGESDITAVTGKHIGVVQVSFDGKVKAAGQKVVVSNDA